MFTDIQISVLFRHVRILVANLRERVGNDVWKQYATNLALAWTTMHPEMTLRIRCVPLTVVSERQGVGTVCAAYSGAPGLQRHLECDALHRRLRPPWATSTSATVIFSDIWKAYPQSTRNVLLSTVACDEQFCLRMSSSGSAAAQGRWKSGGEDRCH